MGEKLIYPTIVTVLIDLFTTSRIQHTDSSDNPNFSTEAHNTNFAVSPTPYACAQPYRLRSGSHELISMAWPQARGLTHDHLRRRLLLRRYTMLMRNLMRTKQLFNLAATSRVICVRYWLYRGIGSRELKIHVCAKRQT